ncbi:MAG: hypothetical protein PHH26_00480 [Candidatus Thermoplasmatota archaeon]|nr:hypothetical protein [Candidatus Thermoplasmatota archaeon]
MAAEPIIKASDITPEMIGEFQATVKDIAVKDNALGQEIFTMRIIAKPPHVFVYCDGMDEPPPQVIEKVLRIYGYDPKRDSIKISVVN